MSSTVFCETIGYDAHLRAYCGQRCLIYVGADERKPACLSKICDLLHIHVPVQLVPKASALTE